MSGLEEARKEKFIQEIKLHLEASRTLTSRSVAAPSGNITALSIPSNIKDRTIIGYCQYHRHISMSSVTTTFRSIISQSTRPRWRLVQSLTGNVPASTSSLSLPLIPSFVREPLYEARQTITESCLTSSMPNSEWQLASFPSSNFIYLVLFTDTITPYRPKCDRVV